MELKKTLLMPRTAFEMRGNLNKKEPVILAKWEKEDLYRAMNEKRKDCEVFMLHDGPPYANGNIHCGHMLNRLLKDFIIRYKNMRGYLTPFVLGWDTHGLPIENEITKQGINRKTTPINEFRLYCQEYALKQIEKQKEQIVRLGVLSDLEHPYFTLQKEYEAKQIEVFAKMALDGLIYKGLKPVHWSPSSESALAEAEIEYFDVSSPSIYVSFKLIDELNGLKKGDQFLIWTTTPWTLPANLALSVHPRFVYGLYQTSKGRFVFLEEFAERLVSELELKDVKLIKTFKGEEFEYLKVQHPFYDRSSLVLVGEHVTNEAGTGLVHTAPGHGLDDYYVCQKYQIEPYCPVDSRGYMMSEAGEKLSGLFYEKANDVVLDMLKENNALIKSLTSTHAYPHDWRTKKPLIFRSTPQWFISISPIKEKLLLEVKNVKWIPTWGQTRMENMIKDRLDWCISRQRAWGVPIPIIYAEDNTPLIEKEIFDHLIKLFAEHGASIWYEKEAVDLLPENYRSKHSPNHQFSKEVDIMDVWFDSGSSFHAVLNGRNLKYPCDLYLEGNDQYRGWFNSSLTISTAVFNHSPFKACLTHGFVVDENWAKMSKSKGNGIDPTKVANDYGADLLRLWAATIDYKQDVRISESIVMQMADVYRKVRNTFKFLLGNLSSGENSSFDPKMDKVETYEVVDLFLFAQLEKVKNEAINSFDEYEFAQGINKILTFISRDLSSFYLDLTKDILYCESKNSLRRKQVQNVLYEVTTTLMRLLTPFLSFTMDEVNGYLPGEVLDNAQLYDYPEVSHLYQKETLNDYEAFLLLRDRVLKVLEDYRSAGEIGSSQEAKLIFKKNHPFLTKLHLLNNKTELARLFVVSQVEFKMIDEEIKVEKADGEKCPRCWNYVKELKTINEHAVCARCHDVLEKDYHDEEN